MSTDPTPESDEVFGPKVSGVRSRKCRDIERRLIAARTTLLVISKGSASWRIRKLAAEAFNATRP